MLDAIVMDMDGTLLDPNNKILPETKEALIACQKQGTKLVLASGRSYTRLLSYAKELEMDVYGGYLLEVDGIAYYDVQKDERHVLKQMYKEDVEKLGICNGDFICIDTKTQITESGFIKSRFLDDKISATALMGVLKCLKDNNITPQRDLVIMFSTYEEVGHGASCLPEEVEELLAVDMGCIGTDLACTEQDVSICAKDSSGPYDYEMITRLVELSKENKLNYAVDIYPQYGSDVSAALRGGNDIKGALIGPGVHASHGMERTHYDGVESTMKLVVSYITKY